MKKWNLALFCLLLTLPFLFSCAKKPQDGKRLEIAIWGTVKEMEIIKDTIRVFNKKYPDIQVVIAHAPQGQGYIDKLLTRAASSSMPDIMFCEVNFVDQFIEKNMLMDISGFLSRDREIRDADFFPEIINRFKRGRKLYGLPRDVAPFACVFYNKGLYDASGVAYPKDGWNMNQFLDAARKLTKRNAAGEIEQFGFFGWSWQNFVYAFGGKLVDNVKKPRKCMLNRKEAVEGITFYRDLMHKYKVMPAPNTVEMGYNEMFMTGKVAMYGSGIWDSPTLRDIKNFKWDVVMFPKGPRGIRGFATGGSGYGISSTSKNPEMAWELLKFMAGETSQVKLAETGLAQPALKKLAYGKVWAQDPNPPVNKGMLNEAVRFIIYNPYNTRWAEIEQKYINQRMDLVIRNELDIVKAVNEIAKDVDRELAK